MWEDYIAEVRETLPEDSSQRALLIEKAQEMISLLQREGPAGPGPSAPQD
jgi:hypothetical protein